MKILWMPFLITVFVLIGCTPDQTLSTLVPKEALAVILVDHPGVVAQLLDGSVAELPWKSLDGTKPWAAAVVPANPPGILVAVALADQDQSWQAVAAWAKDRGGLSATRIGTYAVFTSPGLAAPSTLTPAERFDLDRVRVGNDPVAVYLDVKNLTSDHRLPLALQRALDPLSWGKDDLAGVRLGLNSQNGGLEVRLATDLAAGSPLAATLKGLDPPADMTGWSGWLPKGDGFGLVASISPQVWGALRKEIPDQALQARWEALAPLLGPRVSLTFQNDKDGQWTWTCILESRDPQGVRQALKTLVASGDLQRNFPGWALDPDTPVVYQDFLDGEGGVKTRLLVGKLKLYLAYGAQKLVLSGETGALAGLLGPAGTPASWFRAVPAGARLAATGSEDGLGARGSLEVLGDGNLEVRAWVDEAGLKAWEERLPQAALSWLSGAGGLIRQEP